MFDPTTVEMINALPDIGDLTAALARTRLTRAYLELIRVRVSNEQIGESLAITISQLREMVNSLEIFCLVQFTNEGSVLDSGRAAAFIAAQSIELLYQLTVPTPALIYRHTLADPEIFSKIEAGLLYLIAGYYANARSLIETQSPQVVEQVKDHFDLRKDIANHVATLLAGLLRLELDIRNTPPPNWIFENDFYLAPSELSTSIEARLLLRISVALRSYLAYLAGDDVNNAQNS